MADSLFSYTVVGGERVAVGLEALLEKAKDLRPFWKDVFAPQYFAQVQDGFATGGRARGPGGQFSGGAWAGLSPQYRKWKNQHYPGQPILVRTGALRDSLVWNGNSLGPGGFYNPTATTLEAGTEVPYAAYHQSGTSKMPARPFMPVPGQEWAPIVKAWLLGTAVQGEGMPSMSGLMGGPGGTGTL